MTKVKLEFVSGTTRRPVEIPSWDSLFADEADKEKKVIEARDRD